MRNALANHLGEFVHCKGWIKSWDVIEDKNQFQLTVHHPTIKEPDKNLLFKDQKLISKEDHLHLFFPVELLPSFKDRYSIHSSFCFSGNVIQYIRSNGTFDFGVKETPQTMLHMEFDNLIKYAMKISKSFKEYLLTDDSYLHSVQNVLLPELDRLDELLESAGNNLGTYERTYKEYAFEFKDWRNLFNLGLVLVSQRQKCPRYRRKIAKKRWNAHRKNHSLGFMCSA